MRDAILAVARKEFRAFFASPAAYLFLGTFLAAVLFAFFWVETFFARNIADVRPLFEWLPLLLIFLVAALTMRSWSEERRSGALESLLTSPVSPLALILGKFLAALALVALALLLTVPLTAVVSLLGPLDWGPVVGGYVATLVLAAAYVAIGLYASVRTDNPVVALILTCVVCLLFYLVGSSLLTNLFGYTWGSLFAKLGTGARFESIARGVLDLRDIFYYVSIVGVFVALNRLYLERLRWAGNPASGAHRSWQVMTGLAIANFVAANLWLAPVHSLRADITAGGRHSLSEATRGQLRAMSEPLMLHGYFSAKTHPLLAPLVPQMMDLLREYQAVSGGRVRVEFVDPTASREAEEAAASRYGVRPVPFQTADRHQAAVVNSYFDVVVAYGDQHEVLGFRDLIEVKSRGDGQIDVVLANPEYAVTGAIRKAVGAWRAGGTPFDRIDGPVTFTGYFSPDEHLPEPLQRLRGDVQAVLDGLIAKSGGKLTMRMLDPDAQDGAVAQQLERDYGFAPQRASLFDTRPFWFYMVLEQGGEAVQVPLPETLEKADLERGLAAALQRLTPGALSTVGVLKPLIPGPGALSFSRLEQMLGQNVRIRDTDLASGQVPSDVDLLLVLAPRDLDERRRFAIDQFLMQGGSVILTTSPFDVQFAQSLTATRQNSGLEDWLKHHGVTVDGQLVLDRQSASLAVPVERFIGGLAFRDFRMVPYLLFPDLRGDGLAEDHPVTGRLEQLTVSWASPVRVDADRNKDRKVTELLRSSSQSWLSDSLDMVPDYDAYPESGFAVSEARGRQPLAVAVQGRFESFFKGKTSPLVADAAATPPAAGASTPATPAATPTISGVISQSPESARLIVVASNSFASDAALDLASQAISAYYDQPVSFLQNAVDWSLEDAALVELRGRTMLARTLDPLGEGGARRWEWINYVLALLGVLAVWGWRRVVAGRDRAQHARVLAEA